MSNTKYIYLETVPSSFKDKDGTIVNGFNLFLLERVSHGDRVFWNVVRKWVHEAPEGAVYGAECAVTFDSNGKFVCLTVL